MKREDRLKSKTFGLRTPTDLYYKMLFDIERLEAVTSTLEARYAAFDCAVDAWHLVDWTLHAVDDATHERLSGCRRHGRKANKTAEVCFMENQKSRLPDLEICHTLATNVKHREMRIDKMPNLTTGSKSRFLWSDTPDETGQRVLKGVALSTYFKIDDVEYRAVERFEAMASQWRIFLVEEGCFEFRPEFPEG